MAGFTYKSYSFTDKDPIIDFVRTVVRDSRMSLKKLGDESGVNPKTIANWLYGDTKRPSAAALNAVLRVCDYKLNVTGIKVPSMIKPTAYEPKAITPEQMREYHARVDKLRKVKLK